MAHAPFSVGDHVEYAGSRIGEVLEGPQTRGDRGPCYLVAHVGPPDGTAPAWLREGALQPADMREWVHGLPGEGYFRRPPAYHLAARAAEPHRPLLCCGKDTASLPGRDLVTRDPAKVTCAARKPASRYWCACKDIHGSGLQHSSGTGLPTRKSCAYCKGSLIIERGLWGVFRWRGDGRYPWEDAIATYTRGEIANARSTSDEAKRDDPEHGGWSVRWIPLGS